MNPDERKKLFISLASQLCGVRVGDDLNFLQFVTAEIGQEKMDRLLGFYQQQSQERKSQFEAAGAALADKNEGLGNICRSILKLRLLGIWYPPEAPDRPKKLVSAQAFTHALCWKIMQAHTPALAGPMDGPKYWSIKPQDLGEVVPLLSESDEV